MSTNNILNKNRKCTFQISILCRHHAKISVLRVIKLEPRSRPEWEQLLSMSLTQTEPGSGPWITRLTPPPRRDCTTPAAGHVSSHLLSCDTFWGGVRGSSSPCRRRTSFLTDRRCSRHEAPEGPAQDPRSFLPGCSQGAPRCHKDLGKAFSNSTHRHHSRVSQLSLSRFYILTSLLQLALRSVSEGRLFTWARPLPSGCLLQAG